MAETNDVVENERQVATRKPDAPATNGRTDEATPTELDFRASRIDFLDYEAGAGGERRQSLRGFEDHYTDIIDYIVRCTHRMWEEGGVGLLYEYYSHNAVVWSDWGQSYGRDQTIEYVVQRMAGFPNLRIYANDVIWAGDDVQGFRTCHRITQTGHNWGYSKYGPPTNRPTQSTCFANCVMRENRIYEEWLVVDEMTVVRQLGLDPDAVLRGIAGGVLPPNIDIVGESVKARGQGRPDTYVPRNPDQPDVEDFLRSNLHELWNWRMLNRISDLYAPNCVIHAPSGRELYGLGDAKALVVALMASFPDARFEVDDLYWNGDERMGYRTAVRWSLTGTHRGVGIWGKPTGRPVHIIGTTSHIIRDGKIVEEWTLFNELALLWKLHYA